MATSRLPLLRRLFLCIAPFAVLSLLAGCGGGDDGGQTALAPGSGPSGAPPGPVDTPPYSRFPPVIPGTPRIPAPDNTPILLRSLQEVSDDIHSAAAGCEITASAGARFPAVDLSTTMPTRSNAATERVETVTLRGIVAAPSAGGSSFILLGHRVRVSQHLHDFGDAEANWTAGTNVLVRGDINGAGELVANALQTLPDYETEPCIAGRITEIDATNPRRMRIGELWIDTAAAPRSDTPMTIGMQVVAEGAMHPDRREMTATHVAPLRPIEILLEGPITALDGGSGQFTVFNTQVRVPATTAIASASLPRTTLSFAQLRRGDWVRVAAWREERFALAIAVLVTAAPNGSEAARLTAPITGMTARGDTLIVLDTTLAIGVDTRFELDGQASSADAFFSGIDSDGTLSVEGWYIGETLWARRISAPALALH